MKVERLQQRVEALHVTRDPVKLRPGGLVRSTEPQMVGHDRTMAGTGERADELAVQEAPRRVAMHEHHGTAVARTLVDVVHAPIRRLEPARLIGPEAAKGPV